MTADGKYVAQVAEMLTEHRPRGFSHRDECSCGWSIPDRAGWADRRAHDLHVAEVLAAAGLIPTRTEWGVRHSQGVREERNEKWAREWAEGDVRADSGRKIEARGRTQLVSRPVHDWKDATDD